MCVCVCVKGGECLGSDHSRGLLMLIYSQRKRFSERRGGGRGLGCGGGGRGRLCFTDL